MLSRYKVLSSSGTRMNTANLTILCKERDLEVVNLLMSEVLINSDVASPKLGYCQRKQAILTSHQPLKLTRIHP